MTVAASGIGAQGAGPSSLGLVVTLPRTDRIPEYANANEIPTALQLFIDLIVMFEIQKHYSVIFLVDFINKYGRPNMNPPFTF